MANIEKQQFVDRLKTALSNQGIDVGRGLYTTLAKEVGVSVQTAKDWFDLEKGCPRAEQLALLGQRWGISIDYLLLGNNYERLDYIIPIYTAGEFIKADKEQADYESRRMIPVWKNLNEPFAIELENESMLNILNLRESFPSGLIIIFEKLDSNVENVEIENGSFVFAQVENFGVFAKFIRERGQTYLMTMNPNYPNYNNFRVLGKMSYFVGAFFN
ncbi:S24 family peptidase [Suttonella ornithocola]|uniref:Peptidase S24/S26A/S26B/S26C domain-containing protein n=1 Tax=Suttonella ornithocola TaxID=279832 RepID=A0A380MVG1_9GAMM|nr:S24 family peptidase [Suttonella ornithocola]SUO96174.1 Uncharacterised protein [Suttonella ornithocola]